MDYKSINLTQKFSLFDEKWKLKVIAELNDHQFKIVKIEGEFIWHKHEKTDKAFMVLDGELRIDFRDGFVEVKEGEIFIVPKGVEHKPYAEKEVKLMLIEPKETQKTDDDVWI